ncbi:MAG: hypothetical protein ACTSQ8_19215 [Candidatus Helarchaeota archaeon]
MNKKEIRTQITKKRIFQRYIFGDNLKLKERILLGKYYDNCIKDETRWKWYSNKEVLFEIVKSLRYREANFQIMKPPKLPIRWLNIGSLDFLVYNFFSYHFLEKPYTLHRSLATYSKLPHFPDGAGRGKHIKENWTRPKKYLYYFSHRDIGFDIDEGYGDAKKLFKFLNEFNIRYSVWCSGKKGFHFILPDNPAHDIDTQFEINRTLADDIGDYLNISIDSIPATINIAYFKCPMTLDGRNNRVILPLTKEQFRKFNFKILDPDNILKTKNQIRNRGNLMINPEGRVEEVLNMIMAI